MYAYSIHKVNARIKLEKELNIMKFSGNLINVTRRIERIIVMMTMSMMRTGHWW
jgi:hypothetical protein